MKIKDILQRDPSTHPLVNQGQARISDKENEKALQEIRGELSTFVCEGQYADGVQKILSSFLANLSHSSQKGAWVSGFYGSGKSHLLKMLCHLWEDTKFPDGATARNLVPALPDELKSLLKELDTAGKRAGGLLAAAGSLPSGTTDHVRLTILSILFRSCGLPDQYPQAQFCLWLYDQGWYERVKKAVESAGKVWFSELNNLYVSSLISKAVLSCDPGFASSEAEARKTLREQFPQRTTDITTDQFLATFKRVLKLKGRDGRVPCTILILDEVQQYIGDSNDRSTLVTEVTEALSKQLDSNVIVVGAGQSALTEIRLLHKLMDRFTIRVPLSDTDVETVTRKVLLQKKPAAISTVKNFLGQHSGEISRQLQGTHIGENAKDSTYIVDDYPLLPVRRRFWEHCFRQVDAAGTHSQLRSQLRIIHDAVAQLSGRDLGAVVPGDDLFEALAPEMVNTGVLLRELNERIIGLSKDGTLDGKLARRICGIVFLIGKLPREANADIGVLSTKEHIADLLVDDLSADNGKLRSRVENMLEQLANDGTLMKLGDEYRLQTKEGAEWDREFRLRQSKLVNDDTELQIKRDQFLYAEASRIVSFVKIIQGAAKEARPLVISREDTPPQSTGENIPIWIRDGWSASEKEILDAAKLAGLDSPVAFVFIPRRDADDIKKFVIEAVAAEQTIGARGTPTTAEGEEAKRSMNSRLNAAVKQRDELIKQAVAHAKVFQGGGSELLQTSLEDKIREAALVSLARLFPRFKEADFNSWDSAIKRAREGTDQPFQFVGYTGPIEQHPVCQQVLATIGAGKVGTEIRKTLKASPFGWPQDAIDAALIALHRSQHISAVHNGTPLNQGQLDQSRIPKTEFKVEQITLSVTDRLKIRKLYQITGITCKGGEELAKAQEFLEKLIALAASAGGNPPLPAPPSTSGIEALRSLVGNALLVGIKDKAADLENNFKDWTQTRALIEARKPGWEVVTRLEKHAEGLLAAEDDLAQVKAVCTQRLLLAPTDPVAPLRTSLTEKLRKELVSICDLHQKAYQKGLEQLENNEPWQQISQENKANIIASAGLKAPQTPDVSSDSALLDALDTCSLSARRSDLDAVQGRIQKALAQAAKILEPEVQNFSVEKTTLRSEEDVLGWVERQKQLILDALKNGPVFIN